MKKTLTVAATLVALCAGAAHGVEAERKEKKEQSSLQRVQERMALIKKKSGDYYAAKAQCWIDMARHNHFENDRSGIVDDAVEQADLILTGIETGKFVAGADFIQASEKIREDLWARAKKLKGEAPMRCVAAQVACIEVQLNRMGYENRSGGWRHANPYVGMAEKMIAKAEQDSMNCGSGK